MEIFYFFAIAAVGYGCFKLGRSRGRSERVDLWVAWNNYFARRLRERSDTMEVNEARLMAERIFQRQPPPA
jgi:hypothetical protein